MSGKIDVVVGGQFGSEAKGHVAANLAARCTEPILAIRTGGPNAGHIVHDRQGRVWKLRQVPTAAITRPDAALAIAAGSEVDPDVLAPEVQALDAAGYQVSSRLTIDPTATLIEPHHREAETGLVGRIGSTGKGIGAARAQRIMRDAHLAYQLGGDWCLGSVQGQAAQHLRLGGRVLIEATQGYGLGLHTDYYPFCTSGDCTAVDALAAAQISPWMVRPAPNIWVIMRTRPIRVAGPSGPLFGETSWEAVGLAPEYTTVTGKVRRVGTWDSDLARRAVYANGGPSDNVQVVLMMWDHECPGAAGISSYQDLSIEQKVSLGIWRDRIRRQTGVRLAAVGTGPSSMIWIPTQSTLGRPTAPIQTTIRTVAATDAV